MILEELSELMRGALGANAVGTNKLDATIG